MVALYVTDDKVTEFDNFRVEYIKKKKKIGENENIKTNIYRIQRNDLIKCGYFCIGFINVKT